MMAATSHVRKLNLELHPRGISRPARASPLRRGDRAIDNRPPVNLRLEQERVHLIRLVRDSGGRLDIFRSPTFPPEWLASEVKVCC